MKYAIWNKQDPIITPTGAVFTADEWKQRYPVAQIDSITILCSAGEINGGIFSTLGQTVDAYEERGCDFSGCTTPEEKVVKINAFDEEQRLNAEVQSEDLTAASLASIAASLEYQNMMSLEDTI